MEIRFACCGKRFGSTLVIAHALTGTAHIVSVCSQHCACETTASRAVERALEAESTSLDRSGSSVASAFEWSVLR